MKADLAHYTVVLQNYTISSQFLFLPDDDLIPAQLFIYSKIQEHFKENLVSNNLEIIKDFVSLSLLPVNGIQGPISHILNEGFEESFPQLKKEVRKKMKLNLIFIIDDAAMVFLQKQSKEVELGLARQQMLINLEGMLRDEDEILAKIFSEFYSAEILLNWGEGHKKQMSHMYWSLFFSPMTRKFTLNRRIIGTWTYGELVESKKK